MRTFRQLMSDRRGLVAWTTGAALLTGCGSDTGSGGGAATNGNSNTGTMTLPAAQEAKPVDAVTIANELIALWSNDSASGAKFAADSKAINEMGGGCDTLTEPVDPNNPDPGSTGTDGQPSDSCGEFDAEAAAKDVQDWFAEQFFDLKFVDEKLSTSKLVVLCATAENMCGKTYDDQGVETINTKCADGLAKVPVCLAISWHGDKKLSGMVFVGGDMAIQPVTFQLTPEVFNVQVDLANISKAAKAFSAATGEALPEEFPSTLVGKVSAALVHGTGKMVSGSVSIGEKVHIAAFDKSDKRHYDVQVAAAKDALTLVLGKQERAILGAVKLGAIDVAMATDMMFGGNSDCGSGEAPTPGGGEPTPGDPGKGQPIPDDDGCGTPPPNYTGTLLAHLAGLSFSGAFAVAPDGSNDSIDIQGIGLGAGSSTASFDDGTKVQALGSVDLNADAGRTFDFAAKFDGKMATFSTVPKLVLAVAHSLAPLAAQVKDIPTFLHAGKTSISFSADGKPTFEMGGFDDPAPDAQPGTDPGKGIDPGTDTDPATGTDPGMGTDPGSNGGSYFPHMKVLIGTLTLQATGLMTVPADVLVTIQAGMCLDSKPDDNSGGSEGGGTDGGGEKAQPHLFSQLIEAICK